ncbi:MAG TPA: Hpt domain-containing protein [Desulfobacteraceae bacterium]|nr:Hpt domain-containing protein [Deltaproteobacteria bacterium]HDH86975.1 Hpt domain-containing protein [Desulfobacteraceae bacterium]
MQIQNLADNLGLDVEDFNEVFEIYMETTSSDLEELKRALDQGDAEKVHQKAHSIKGASGNLGLNELFELAKEIDDSARVNSLNGLESLVQAFYEKYERLVEEFGKGS